MQLLISVRPVHLLSGIPGDKSDVSCGDFLPANWAIRQMPFYRGSLLFGVGLRQIADQSLTGKVLHEGRLQQIGKAQKVQPAEGGRQGYQKTHYNTL